MKSKRIIVGLLAFVLMITVYSVTAPKAEADTNSTYWIKVNTQASVVTVYEKSGEEYVPCRAMLCSAGLSGTETPNGTYQLGRKIGWCRLVGGVWGQYSMVISGDYLFHSVPYDSKSKSAMNVTEFNKLGNRRSHGCVRMSVMDVKWIWDNCPVGTTVTIYESSDPGPLGKPEPILMDESWNWDPTDPDHANPNFNMRLPKISIDENKIDNISYGDTYSLMEGVTAANTNAIQDLTSKVEVSAIYKYDYGAQEFVESEFSTKSPGKYKIVYSVYDEYCGGTGAESFDLTVNDKNATMIIADDRELVLSEKNAKNAVKDVVVMRNTSILTKAMSVIIVEPDGAVNRLSYAGAKKFEFTKAGTYKVTYCVSDYYGTGIVTTKAIKITCK